MNRTILFFAFMLIATGARGNDYAGIYILVSVDETAIPGMVSHEGHDMMLYSGVFTIHAGGTCISQTVFSVPSGEKITRQLNATHITAAVGTAIVGYTVFIIAPELTTLLPLELAPLLIEE